MLDFKKKDSEVETELLFSYYNVYRYRRNQPDSQDFWDITEAIMYGVNNYHSTLYSLYEKSVYKGSDGKIYIDTKFLATLPNLANKTFTEYNLAEPMEDGNPKYICGYIVRDENDLNKDITLNKNFDKFENVSLYRYDSKLNDDNKTVTINYTLLRDIKKNGKVKKKN